MRKVLAVLALALAPGGEWFARGGDEAEAEHDPFSQAEFACHEDDALMFDERFGSDEVGCVAIGELAP